MLPNKSLNQLDDTALITSNWSRIHIPGRYSVNMCMAGLKMNCMVCLFFDRVMWPMKWRRSRLWLTVRSPFWRGPASLLSSRWGAPFLCTGLKMSLRWFPNLPLCVCTDNIVLLTLNFTFVFKRLKTQTCNYGGTNKLVRFI